MDIEESSQPPWWILLIVLALMIGLLALVHWLVPSPGWREVLDIGVLFFSYGLVVLWFQMNSAALNNEYSGRTQTRITIIDPPVPSDDLAAQFYMDSDSTIVYEENGFPAHTLLRNN